jgi:16S rRNA G527 N7-methylase RsmG
MLRREFDELELDIPVYSQQRLALYASEIEHWNKAVNLTSLSGSALLRRLIIDPVWVGQYLQMDGVGVMWDPRYSLASPEVLINDLIEPRMKRAAFLRHVISKVGLTDVAVHRCRIEEMPEKSLFSDWITLQAIDPTPALIESLRRIACDTTRVVWITSVSEPPVADSRKLEIPGSTTKIWIFRLDQI